VVGNTAEDEPKKTMPNYELVAVGAVAMYAVFLHMYAAYITALWQSGKNSVSATEADVASQK